MKHSFIKVLSEFSISVCLFSTYWTFQDSSECVDGAQHSQCFPANPRSKALVKALCAGIIVECYSRDQKWLICDIFMPLHTHMH